MDLRKMIARVYRALPAVPPGKIGEPDIIDMLNDAQRSLAVFSNQIATEEAEVDAGEDTVDFPEDLFKLVGVYWGDDTDKRELYPDKKRLPTGIIADDITGGPSKYYTPEKGKIVLRSVPSQDGTVTISYIPRPAVMANDADTPDLEDSGEYLIAHALRQFHMENNSPMMQMWEQKRQEALKEWQDSSNQNYDTPFQVKGSW